jgi:hypothetical protein
MNDGDVLVSQRNYATAAVNQRAHRLDHIMANFRPTRSLGASRLGDKMIEIVAARSKSLVLLRRASAAVLR